MNPCAHGTRLLSLMRQAITLRFMKQLYGASNGIRTRIFCMASRNTNHYTIPAYMEPATGVEPATYWLQVSCAANCATPAEKGKEFGEQFQSHASSMELHNFVSATCVEAELVLRVFHWWGRYCLHLTFNACLRTHGPRYRIRTGPICLEGRDASRWHQSRIWRFLSQPLYKYYITIFKKNQIFTLQNLQVGVVIWSCGAKPTLQIFVTAQCKF